MIRRLWRRWYIRVGAWLLHRLDGIDSQYAKRMLELMNPVEPGKTPEQSVANYVVRQLKTDER